MRPPALFLDRDVPGHRGRPCFHAVCFHRSGDSSPSYRRPRALSQASRHPSPTRFSISARRHSPKSLSAYSIAIVQGHRVALVRHRIIMQLCFHIIRTFDRLSSARAPACCCHSSRRLVRSVLCFDASSKPTNLSRMLPATNGQCSTCHDATSALIAHVSLRLGYSCAVLLPTGRTRITVIRSMRLGPTMCRSFSPRTFARIFRPPFRDFVDVSTPVALPFHRRYLHFDRLLLGY